MSNPEISPANDAHEQMSQQEQLLQSIYDTVPCGILRFLRKDGQYHVVSLNRAALEFLSYDSEAACMADWHNGIAGTVLPEDWPVLQHSNEILTKVGDRTDVAYRVRRPDGGIRWLSGINTLLSSDPSGDVIQRAMFDVTQRHLLQERLDREQEMYRVAMESGSYIMYEYLPEEDTLVSYEPVSDSDDGQTVIQQELRSFQKRIRADHLVHPDDVQDVINNICHGQAEIFEARFRTSTVPENEYWWYRVTGKVILSQARPRRVVGTLQNIHREKLALFSNQEALHMSQSALQALNNIYDSIFYIDLAADHYYGIRISERDRPFVPRTGSFYAVLYRYFLRLASPEDRERLHDLRSLSDQLREVGDRFELDFRSRGEEPETLWLRLVLQLTSTMDGEPGSLICAFRNVTEQRKRELEQQQEEARAKAALETAYRSANQANQAKSEFFSKMSHDMRTPMNAIMGMTTIAKEQLTNPARLEDCLDKIQLSSRHLLDLINEVLDMSKIESGSFGLNESAFDLTDLVHRAAEMIQPTMDAKHHQLTLALDKLAHGTVMGDPVRIQQILLNLLSNAAKYTPDGGHITLRLEEPPRTVNSTSRYILTVEDDGIGMSPEFQKRLFQPFERAEDSRVSHIQGTGLGMAITYNLVQMMNGSIQVESQLERGTRFTVTLHLRTTESQEPHPAAPPAAKSLRFPKPARILLVDDNDLNREIARDLLEMQGLVVEEAANGAQALERFRQSAPGHYRLILMDILMPVMDGYQAAQAIRALERPDAVSVPIIALTANAFADDISRAFQAGMNEHLAKPLDVTELLQILASWLVP